MIHSHDSSVLCLFMKATVYLWYYPRSIHPFFFIACPIQGQSPAYCRDSAQRQRTIYAPIRSYNLFRIISYTNKNVLGLWRKPCMHRQTAHTKMPQRAGRFESRPFLLWGNDVVQIFSRKKGAVAETNMFECLGWCNRTIHPSVLTAYQLQDHRELARQEMSLHFTPCFGSTQMPPVDKPLQCFNNKMPTLRTLSANVQQVTFTIIFAILFHQFSMLTLAI